MGYVVTEADVEENKNLLLSILTNNREIAKYPYEKRYDWIYKYSPYGKAIAWIIWDDNNNIPAGFTAVYPRKMLVAQKEVNCWNCGDFSIEKKYRSLGVAIKLRKEAKRFVDEGKIPFLYAHPNDRMLTIHLKAGHKRVAYMKRYALPLRISKYISSKTFSGIISKIADPMIGFVQKKRFSKIGEYDIQNQSIMKFDDSYRDICEGINKENPVCGLRDNVYLSWKYKNHPILEYNLFNYYVGNRLCGYIIYYIKNNIVNMVEIVCIHSTNQTQNMLHTFISAMLSIHKDLQAIISIQQEYNPVVSALLEVGFKYRPDATSSTIAYTANKNLADMVYQGKLWFMNSGDRDS